MGEMNEIKLDASGTKAGSIGFHESNKPARAKDSTETSLDENLRSLCKFVVLTTCLDWATVGNREISDLRSRLKPPYLYFFHSNSNQTNVAFFKATSWL